MGNGKKYVPELTVSQAASILEVSPRTIINYIQNREIEATKVGKSWYIKAPSFDSFCQRYKFKPASSTASTNQQNVEVQQEQQATQESPAENPTPRLGNKKKRATYSITQLRLFELSCEILQAVNAKNLNLSNEKVAERIEMLKQDAIELLGAGCYSFSKKDKQRLYQESREKIGGIVSLYYFESNENAPAKSIKTLEEDLLPAYSALIRKIENSNTREKQS